MQKFLMIAGSVAAGTGAVRAMGDTGVSLLLHERNGQAWSGQTVQGVVSAQRMPNTHCQQVSHVTLRDKEPADFYLILDA